MLAWTRQILVAPVYEDEEKTRVARLLNVVLLTLLGTCLAAIPILAVLYSFPWTQDQIFTLGSTAGMAVLLLGLWALARRGYLRLASVAILVAIWGIMTYWILTAAGIGSDSSPMLYPLIVVLAGVLLGGRAALAFTLLCILSALAAYYAETFGFLVVVETPITVMDPFMAVLAVLLTGTLLYYAVENMIRALARARTNERAQIEANRELEAMRASLEQRVASRTRDLERHSQHLQAAVEVGRAVTSILDPEELLWQTAELIRDRFDLYHVGVFQVDAARQWALYCAGAGEGAMSLAEEGFRLEIGGQSLVGWCTAHGQARIALDVSQETGRYDHPKLSHTRSEAVLPLVARGQILGAFSAQSERLDAFDDQTVASLQTMADQVAVALDNARLYAESQHALEATRRAYGELSRQAWSELLRARGDWGYVYAGRTVVPARDEWQPEMLQAMQTGSLVQGGDGHGPLLSLPLQVRNEVIGALGFSKGEQGEIWTAEEIDLLETLTRQLGAVLESAQLFEETQRRAARERLTGDVAARIRETLDLDTVLKTAVQEIRQALGVPEVVVRLAALPVVSSPAEGNGNR